MVSAGSHIYFPTEQSTIAHWYWNMILLLAFLLPHKQPLFIDSPDHTLTLWLTWALDNMSRNSSVCRIKVKCDDQCQQCPHLIGVLILHVNRMTHPEQCNTITQSLHREAVMNAPFQCFKCCHFSVLRLNSGVPVEQCSETINSLLYYTRYEICGDNPSCWYDNENNPCLHQWMQYTTDKIITSHYTTLT